MKHISKFLNDSRNIDAIHKVINTYVDNIDELDYQHQQHFLNRLKLCSGYKLEYETLINQLGLISKINDNILELVNVLQFGDIEESFKTHILELYDAKLDDRKKKVHNYLIENDSIQFKTILLLGILLEQFSVYLKMKPSIDGNEWIEIKKLITDNFSLIENFCNDEQNILNIPVNVVNLLYYARYVCEVMEMNSLYASINILINNVTRILLLENSKNSSINLIYGLTHIIIGESAFYTRSIHKNPSLYLIGDYLAEYLEKGNDLTNDIRCEAALCLKLIDEVKYNTYIEEVKEKSFAQLSYSKPILYNFKPGLQNNEHTNILLILLVMLNVLP